MNKYPPLQELLKQKKELLDRKAVLFETRRSVRSIFSQLLLFFAASAVVIVLNMTWPDGNLLAFFSKSYFLSIRWLAVIPTLLFLEAIRKYHDDLYTFTAHNLTHYDGRLSLNYNVPNIRYVDIRAVVVYQDILGRVLDYGDIEIDTAAQEQSEMYLSGVRAPQELAGLIEGLRAESKKEVTKGRPEYEISQD